MKKLNQAGFLGPLEILAVVFLVGLIGFTAWRVISIRSNVDNSLRNTNDSSESGALNPIKVNEPKDETKEVTIPEKEVPKETVAVAEEEVKPKPKPEEVKKKINYVSFNKGGGGQQDDQIHVSGTMGAAFSGTCHFKFKMQGQEKFYVTSTISNSKTCEKYIPASLFPASGTWSFYLWFTSSDGKTQAYQDPYDIEVTL